MCGIAGVLSHDLPDEAALDRMSAAIAHRGPDSHGQWQAPGVVLLHRRLSIIDVEHGQQPMVSDDGTAVVTFNGEIYNYPQLRRELEDGGRRFRTNCDTEVLLHLYQLYGPRFVTRLRGMFAFAVWDLARRRLVLARDHLGQKPIFYRQSGGDFAFASEIKALLASSVVPPQLDLDALWHHAGLRFCPGDTTLFRGVNKLPPAHVLVWRPDDSTARIERYWHLDYSQKASLPFDHAVDQLDTVLSETVKQHLLSDVSVGSFLSGGIDSSLVAAFASRHSGEGFPTFSIGVTDGDFSELPYARRAAEVVGSKHTEFKVEADLMLLLPEIVWHLEEPGDPHAVGVYLLSRLARPHVKVALGGDGGDEAFGGYTRFTRSRALSLYSTLPSMLRARLVAPLLRHLPESYSYYSVASKARWVHDMSMTTGAARQYCALSFFRFPDAHRKKLFTPEARARIEDPNTVRWIAEHHDVSSVSDDFDRLLYTEQMTRMPEHDLRISDRMSMAHGLELRAPLVDYRVSEFAATLPHDFKVRPGQLKIILRALANRYYPSDLIERPKLGFGFPMARWFKGPLASFVSGIVGEAEIYNVGLFDRAYIDSIVSDHRAGRVDHAFKIWTLVNLAVWHRLYLEGHSREDVRDWLASFLPRATHGAPVSA